MIHERLQAIIDAREDEDILTLVNLLRSGLVRNLGNITTPKLFNRAFAGTKLLIEDYITQVALAVEYVANYPTSSEYTESHLTSQAKLDLLHDTRQAFGRSALVLQGGAIFGLCHIGVVKALHLRGLLPRIIAGTATGALIAALVGVHPEDELLDSLTGSGLDLSAFSSAGKDKSDDDPSWLGTLWRRIKRFAKDGYFLDVKVLEDCVHANVGDVTFEEAYAKTKRVLNIIIPTGGRNDVPGLLNYLTAPNVLVWSAAVASNSSASTPLYTSTSLLCKDPITGQILPWPPSSTSSTFTGPPKKPSSAKAATDPLRDSPLGRIAELFNVNHFVISQARPYIAPFLQPGDAGLPAPSRSASTYRAGRPNRVWASLLHIVVLEIQHRMRQLDAFGLLPQSVRRLLVDEIIPAASITLVPQLNARDFWGLLERPTPTSIEAWILRGERSVWPSVPSLKVRCAVEVELDRAYQVVRRRKPLDAVPTQPPQGSPKASQLSPQPQRSTSPLQRASSAIMRNTTRETPPTQTGRSLKGMGEKRKRVRADSLQHGQ